MRIKDGNYIVIQSFMVKDLHLKGNELLIYAIIYGFTQDGEQLFTGGIQYLADWLSSSRQTVMSNLKSLVEKGLIARQEHTVNGVKFVNYRSNFLTGGSQISLHRGSQKTLPINKEININNSNNKKAYGEFNNVMLTDDEYAKVKERRLAPLIEELSGYLENLGAKAKGKYNSHYATLLAWGRRRQSEKPKDGKMQRKPSFDIDELKRKAELEDDYDI